MVDTNSRRNRNGGSPARLLGLGFTLGLLFGAPVLVGFLLDRLVGTLPLFLLVGVAAGFAASLYYVYRALRNLGD